MSLFDHVVGRGEQHRRYVNPERSCHLQVDDELRIVTLRPGTRGWRQDLQVLARFYALTTRGVHQASRSPGRQLAD